MEIQLGAQKSVTVRGELNYCVTVTGVTVSREPCSRGARFTQPALVCLNLCLLIHDDDLRFPILPPILHISGQHFDPPLSDACQFPSFSKGTNLKCLAKLQFCNTTFKKPATSSYHVGGPISGLFRSPALLWASSIKGCGEFLSSLAEFSREKWKLCGIMTELSQKVSFSKNVICFTSLTFCHPRDDSGGLKWSP